VVAVVVVYDNLVAVLLATMVVAVAVVHQVAQAAQAVQV
jgi:hypothetical protein